MSYLPEVIVALDSAGRFSGLLDCGQQNSRQDSNNANDHEQFDQRDALFHLVPSLQLFITQIQSERKTPLDW